jgi:hypothetical protein
MLNRIDEMLADLNARPNAAEGFSARTFYNTGAVYGLTCREVLATFLGKEKALSYSKYPAAVSADILAAAKAAPVKKEKKAKAPKAVKATKVARNTSTAVVAKAAEKDEAATANRLALIAKIAKRHAKEDKVIADLVVASSTKTEEDDGTLEEIEKLMNAAPSTAP